MEMLLYVCGVNVCDMKKETFISAIEAIEKQHKHDLECADKIGEVFSQPYAYELTYDNHWLSNALIEVLSEVMNDESAWIEYYLWELDFGKKNDRLKITGNDGEDIPLGTPEDLYNLLTK